MYIIELNKSNIHTYLFTAVLSKGTRKLLKYSYNKYCNLARVNTLQSTNRNQWSIYMAQTNIFATRTADHSQPRREILHVVIRQSKQRDPRASASTVCQAMDRRTRASPCVRPQLVPGCCATAAFAA